MPRQISVPPFSTQAASALGVLCGEHDRVGDIDRVIGGDVVDMHPVRLDAVVEEAAIGAPHGLADRVLRAVVVEQVVPRPALPGSTRMPMSPFTGRASQRAFCAGVVRPFRDGARHVGARRARAVHAVGAEGAEERAVEQRAPAQIEHAGGAAGEARSCVQRRMSSGSTTRPSSLSRPITCGCSQSGPPWRSACQNGLPRAAARVMSTP